MVNTFRYETKQTRSFIRVREIHFFEAPPPMLTKRTQVDKFPKIKELLTV